MDVASQVLVGVGVGVRSVQLPENVTVESILILRTETAQRAPARKRFCSDLVM